MSSVPIVGEIWRYPVKSLRGETLQAVEVSEVGIAGDRGWGLLDNETGNILTARREPRLLMASATISAGEPVITLPDGNVANDDSALSEWLGQSVALVAATEDGGTYENPMDAENDADWVSWTGPGGALHDSGRSRLTIASEATLGAWHRERFRINLLLKGIGPRVEDGWVEATLTVGSSVLAVTKRVGRCVMVTRPQPGIERDLDVLRTINRDSHGDLSIGATVEKAGTVSVGDAVAIS